jgi:hypothetical protein
MSLATKPENKMYHISNLGSFGGGITHDMDGYVPEQGDDPFAGAWDHGSESTHDEDGELTEYGEWWQDERFPEIVAEAEAATAKAQEGIDEWRAENA